MSNEPNEYVVDFHCMEKQPTLGKTSTGEGASFNGERIYCGLVTKKKGTDPRPHYHPDETFNYVLKGALKVRMDGQALWSRPVVCFISRPIWSTWPSRPTMAMLLTSSGAIGWRRRRGSPSLPKSERRLRYGGADTAAQIRRRRRRRSETAESALPVSRVI